MVNDFGIIHEKTPGIKPKQNGNNDASAAYTSTVQPIIISTTTAAMNTQKLFVIHTIQIIHPKVPSHSRFTHDHLIAMLAIHLHRSSHHSLTLQPLRPKHNRQLLLPLRLLLISLLLLLRFLLLPLLLHDATKRLLLLKQAPIYSSPHSPSLTLYRSTHTRTERHRQLQHLQRGHIYPSLHPH